MARLIQKKTARAPSVLCPRRSRRGLRHGANRAQAGRLARDLSVLTGSLEARTAELAGLKLTMEAMERIDRALLSRVCKDELLSRVFEAVALCSPCRRIALALRDEEGGGFRLLAERRPPDKGGPVEFLLPGDSLPEGLLVHRADPFEIPVGALGSRLLDILGMRAREDLLVASLPFETEGRLAGSLILVREGREPSLAQLRPLAAQVGVAVECVSLREERERNWLAVARSLSRAVDAKSHWTRGHSERVVDTALSLGRRLMMGPRELRDLEIAAVLHDVGKIGVSEAILDKPGGLDPCELKIIRSHPVIGADIVEDVPAYGDVREAILYHHEQWDGSGYPRGLEGEGIPIFARIIAIADVYDAISSKRPYRTNLDAEESLSFIERGADRMFDPRLARIFIDGKTKPGAVPA